LQSRRKTREPKEENVTLGPTVREGESVFGVAHIFASFNDTFIVSAGCFFSVDGPFYSLPQFKCDVVILGIDLGVAHCADLPGDLL